PEGELVARMNSGPARISCGLREAPRGTSAQATLRHKQCRMASDCTPVFASPKGWRKLGQTRSWPWPHGPAARAQPIQAVLALATVAGFSVIGEPGYKRPGDKAERADQAKLQAQVAGQPQAQVMGDHRDHERNENADNQAHRFAH